MKVMIWNQNGFALFPVSSGLHEEFFRLFLLAWMHIAHACIHTPLVQ